MKLMVLEDSMDALERKLQEIMLENQGLVGKRRFYPRQLHLERLEGKATVITGIRRSGKTVYEMLYMQELIAKGVDRTNLCILDFSDDRLLALRSREPSMVADAYYDLWPEKSGEKVYFFFDEIQYLPHWELLVNRLQNTRSCEINITGSSARLLVKEIATELGGRSLPWELFPFSFREFLETKEDGADLLRRSVLTEDQRRTCRRYLSEYERCGGFPESIAMREGETRVRYLQNLAETVVFRDVIRRYNLPNPEGCVRLMQMLLGQMAGPMTYAKLKSRLEGEQYHFSAAMVARVVEYLEDAYLLFPIEIFSLNAAVRKTNPKKVYCVDHALSLAASTNLTEDRGKVLENMVCMHLRRKSSRIFYGKTPEGYKIDFIVPGTQPALYRVAYAVDEADTFQREIRALESGMRTYGTDHSCLVTEDREGSFRVSSGTIECVPVWKFLLWY